MCQNLTIKTIPQHTMISLVKVIPHGPNGQSAINGANKPENANAHPQKCVENPESKKDENAKERKEIAL